MTPLRSESAPLKKRMQANGGRSEAGYALLMSMFIVATILLLAASATPSFLTQGRREREQELVWRGGQYVRAFRLYYKKNGRFPQTLDDLKKGDAAGVHYLRKAYADPVNSSDGKWRVIYVSPSGQLTGSIHYHTLQEMAAAVGGTQLAGVGPGAAGAPLVNGAQPAGAAAAPGGQQSGFGQSGFAGGAGTAGPQTSAMAGAQPGQNTNAQAAQGFGGFGSSTQPQAVSSLEAVSGPVMGGSAIGVASTVKKPALRVYQGGKTYFEWEFIWNPLLTPGAVAPNGAAASGAAGTTPVDANGQPVTGTPQPPGVPPAPGAPGSPNQPAPGMPTNGAPLAPPNQPDGPTPANPPPSSANPPSGAQPQQGGAQPSQSSTQTPP